MELKNNSIFKQIEINKNHIENFPLETEKGTKKLKNKFHKNAVIERNKYTNKELKQFKTYNKKVYFELNERVNDIYPIDKNKELNEINKYLEELEKYIIYLDDKMSIGFKMRFEFLINKLTDTISLEELNKILLDFLNKFKEYGIELTEKDFKFTMATEKYMIMFLNNYKSNEFETISYETFKQVYFKCPNLITQLRLNLENILNEYKDDLTKKLNDKLQDIENTININKDNIVNNYISIKKELNINTLKDSYNNLNKFLNKELKIEDYMIDSETYDKNYSLFINEEHFNSLDKVEQEKFKTVIKEMYFSLKELKEFYRYEFIITDIIKRYKEKDKFKNEYTLKSKALKTELGKINKIYKDYNKCIKPNIFGRVNHNKAKVFEMNMNDEIAKLDEIYSTFKNALFNKNLSEYLNEASSIYDLFSVCLYSFSYLEEKFTENFKEDENYNFSNEFDRFFDFLFCPYNEFLRKVNGLVDYDITKVLADKYVILGLKLAVDNINKDNINETIEKVEYVVRNILLQTNKLTLEDMRFICNVKDLKPLEGWENVYEEII